MTKFGPNKTSRQRYIKIAFCTSLFTICAFVSAFLIFYFNPEVQHMIEQKFLKFRDPSTVPTTVPHVHNHSHDTPSDRNDVETDIEPDTISPDLKDYDESTSTTPPLRFSSTTTTTTSTTSSVTPSPTTIPTTTDSPDQTSSGESLEVVKPSTPSNEFTEVPADQGYESEEINPNLIQGETIVVENVKLRPYTKFEGTDVVVKTPLGKVKGIQGEVLGQKVNAFLGVPFAEPPLGPLRFKRTVPKRPWKGVLDTTEVKPHCPQSFNAETIKARTPTTRILSEDCLYLNIWSPAGSNSKSESFGQPDSHNDTQPSSSSPPSDKKIQSESFSSSSTLKPVMVWLFGGGYSGGSNNLDEMDGRVMAGIGDVIVVNSNYRAGSFGFLDLGVDSSPGNQGLYDNKATLEWVQQNIASFGGDPNQVTLFGQSAGAITTGLFMTNNHTSRLFKRAILQSGAPIMLNFYFSRTEETAEKFLLSMNCSLPNEEDETEVTFEGRRTKELDCLRNKSMNQILKGQDPLFEGAYPFTPTPYEQMFPMMATDAFKAEEGSDMYHDSFNNVDEILIGSNRDEASVILYLEMPETFEMHKINLNITKLSELKELLSSNFTKEFNIDPNTASLFSNLFFNKGPEEDTTLNLIRRLYKVIGDLAFVCPVASFAEKLVQRGKKVYQYEFGHRAKHSPWGQWMGVPHGDEYIFTFGYPLRYPDLFSQEDIEMSKRMIDVWTTFAKTGSVPNQMNRRWPKHSVVRGEYAKLQHDSFSVGNKIDEDVCSLFNIGLESFDRRRRSVSIGLKDIIDGVSREVLIKSGIII